MSGTRPFPASAFAPVGRRSFSLRRKLPTGRMRSGTLGSADFLSVAEIRRDVCRVLPPCSTSRSRGRPRYPGRPIAAFAKEFLERHACGWKPSTLAGTARLPHRVILPAFARLTVDAVEVENVRDRFVSMADRPVAANRLMPVLSVMMRMAELWGCRPDNTNSCGNTGRYRMTPKERFLTADEMPGSTRSSPTASSTVPGWSPSSGCCC